MAIGPVLRQTHTGEMIYTSLIVEALRVRPVLVFWLAALAQAAMWFLVPTLFYSAPPGNLAEVLDDRA